jgi:hypothetical protein
MYVSLLHKIQKVNCVLGDCMKGLGEGRRGKGLGKREGGPGEGWMSSFFSWLLLGRAQTHDATQHGRVFFVVDSFEPFCFAEEKMEIEWLVIGPSMGGKTSLVQSFLGIQLLLSHTNSTLHGVV